MSEQDNPAPWRVPKRTFRDLVPTVVAMRNGFRPALRLGNHIIWSGETIYRRSQFGTDAADVAKDEAAALRHIDDQSEMAQRLNAMIARTEGA